MKFKEWLIREFDNGFSLKWEMHPQRKPGWMDTTGRFEIIISWGSFILYDRGKAVDRFTSKGKAIEAAEMRAAQSRPLPSSL